MEMEQNCALVLLTNFKVKYTTL